MGDGSDFYDALFARNPMAFSCGGSFTVYEGKSSSHSHTNRVYNASHRRSAAHQDGIWNLEFCDASGTPGLSFVPQPLGL